jgi:SpoVK/Ycf46/Vps4 family AAA+-type ATPase
MGSEKKRKHEETQPPPTPSSKKGKLPPLSISNGHSSSSESESESEDENEYLEHWKSYLTQQQQNEKKEDDLPKEEIHIPEHLHTLETIDQLIELGSLYDPNKIWKGSIDLRRLHKLIQPLQKLKKMIGMKTLKQSIVDFILFYLQDLDGGINKDYMHTILEGPPGCGKTEIGKILAELYVGMEIIRRNYFRVVKRHELIGQYLGQTAPRTQKVIDDCMGGVLFIDEAYSLGNAEGKDIFSKECLDTLNQNLSEHKNRFVCIIAGYKDALKHSFFSVNEGLISRFPIRFEVDPYDGNELYHIFQKIVKEHHWMFDNDELTMNDFFTKHQKEFPYYGRDMEVLFQKAKIAHAKRIYRLSNEYRKKLTKEDIEKGFELYQKMNTTRKKDIDQTPPPGMYL